MSYTDYGDDRYNAKRVERVLGECEAAWRGVGALGMPDINKRYDLMASKCVPTKFLGLYTDVNIT
jgi:hypothetical protein